MRRNDFSPERLAELRKQKGLSQVKLAELAFSDQSDISRFEYGIKVPTSIVLGRIADVLDCTTDYLLCRSDSVK